MEMILSVLFADPRRVGEWWQVQCSCQHCDHQPCVLERDGRVVAALGSGLSGGKRLYCNSKLLHVNCGEAFQGIGHAEMSTFFFLGAADLAKRREKISVLDQWGKSSNKRLLLCKEGLRSLQFLRNGPGIIGEQQLDPHGNIWFMKKRYMNLRLQSAWEVSWCARGGGDHSWIGVVHCGRG